nr:hypothetical protein [Tanacetum cinerariifolium]
MGNGDDVAIPLESIRAISECEDGLSIIATNLSTHLMIDSYTSDMCTQSWGTSSNAKAMSKLRADEDLKDTIVVDRIKLIGERQLIERKLLLVDVNGKPLPNIVSTVNTDSDNEVEEVYDEHVTFMASIGLKRGSDSGYGTNSLWEQWMKTKRDDNLYDDDLYDSHDMFDNLHAICDEFDIMSSDQKKKWIHFDVC